MLHHAHFGPDRNANPGLVFKAAGASVSLVHDKHIKHNKCFLKKQNLDVASHTLCVRAGRSH